MDNLVESLYFINAVRSEVIDELSESMNDNQIKYITENMTDGDILSLSLTGKVIPSNVDNQSYVDGLMEGFGEMFFECDMDLFIQSDDNSFMTLNEATFNKDSTYIDPKDSYHYQGSLRYSPSEIEDDDSDFYQGTLRKSSKKPNPKSTKSGFDDSKPQLKDKVKHNPTKSGFDDPKPNNNPPTKPKPSSNKIANSSFTTAKNNFMSFFSKNNGKNLKIGLAIAAASALAYGAYKLYKDKYGDKNKAKQAQVKELNKAKSMANKTTDPNKFKQMLADKISKIKRG